jgi:hypothetical protein
MTNFYNVFTHYNKGTYLWQTYITDLCIKIKAYIYDRYWLMLALVSSHFPHLLCSVEWRYKIMPLLVGFFTATFLRISSMSLILRLLGYHNGRFVFLYFLLMTHCVMFISLTITRDIFKTLSGEIPFTSVYQININI